VTLANGDLAQEKANVTLLIMNDGGYGVMRGIQDKYLAVASITELHTPDLTCWRRRWVCRRGAIGLRIFRR
jgi:thiamine pyrophosphate-dependent acetolactate synthase large subunit-like protein